MCYSNPIFMDIQTMVFINKLYEIKNKIMFNFVFKFFNNVKHVYETL